MRNMAIVQYSSLVNKIIGKVGGTVFQKMGQSLGIREHRSFRPSGSQKACKSRVNFNIIGALWASMSLADKQLWGTLAAEYVRYNRYGTLIVLNGWQLFLSIQQVKLLTGVGLDYRAEHYFALPVPSTIAPTYVISIPIWAPVLTVSNPANSYVIVYITMLQTAVQVLTHQKMYFIYSWSGLGMTMPNLYTYCVQLWGRQPLPSERFYFKLRMFNAIYNQWVDSNVAQTIVVP